MSVILILSDKWSLIIIMSLFHIRGGTSGSSTKSDEGGRSSLFDNSHSLSWCDASLPSCLTIFANSAVFDFNWGLTSSNPPALVLGAQVVLFTSCLCELLVPVPTILCLVPPAVVGDDIVTADLADLMSGLTFGMVNSNWPVVWERWAVDLSGDTSSGSSNWRIWNNVVDLPLSIL